MSMYEIQCPNCGIALVIPANNSEEIQEFWKRHQDSGLDFYCPGCRESFKGLCEKPKHNFEVWNCIIDIDGSRFNAARERLNRIFEDQRQYSYLK